MVGFVKVLADARGTAFGVVFSGDPELVAKAQEIAAGYTVGMFDALAVPVRQRVEPTPWAAERTRAGSEPLFVFVTRDGWSHRLVVPGSAGAWTTMEPAELMSRLDREPGFRELDAGPFNRPLVLMMDCLDPTNLAATRRTAVEVLRGQRAYRGYRRIYYPHGALSVLETPAVELAAGEFRLVAEPAIEDVRIAVLPGGGGVRLPLPGDPAGVRVEAGGDFVIGVAGDGERLWPGTRQGRRLTLDGGTFARIVSDHPEVKKMLAGPAGAAIVLASPHAGDRDAPGATGYDFAAGLQPLYAGRPVRATVGAGPATTAVGPGRAAGIHAIALSNASLGLFCVVFPDADEDFFLPPPGYDDWAGRATVASLSRTAAGLRSPWSARRPALVRFHSRDGRRLSVRHVREERRDVIEVPVAQAPGLMLQTRAFRDLAAGGRDGDPVLALVPPGFDPAAAAELAHGLKRELHRRGLRRAAHTLIGAGPASEGRLTSYSFITTDCGW